MIKKHGKKGRQVDAMLACPIIGEHKLKLIPLENLLQSYPPYYCRICDMSFYEDELEKAS